MKQKMIKRKLLSFLLTLALVLGLVPWMSLTAYANPEEYDLWVGGTQVTSENALDIFEDNTASYNAKTNTLTLNGFTYNGNGLGISNSIDGLTVIIINDTNIIGTSIRSFGSLNIKGSGTLKIGGTGVTAIFLPLGDLTISDSVNITIKESGTGISCAGPNSKLTLASTGEIKVKGSSYGLFSDGKIDITNGYVTAEGGITGIGLNGGEAPLVIGTDAKLIAFGGDKGAIYYDTVSDHRTVQNATPGVAWTNKEGTTGGQNIAVNTEGQPISNIYKKVEFSVSHIHNFTYQTGTGANANKIIATCSADGCTLPESGAEVGDHVATLTIAAPTLTTYGQTGTDISADAVITDTDGIKGDATVKYYKATKSGSSYSKGEDLGAAPTDAGDYVAEITLGTATASVGYTIAKAEEAAPAANTDNLTISYTDETISANNGYEVAANNNGTTITSFSTILDESTPTVYIRKSASDDNHDPSAWVAVALSARPPAPSNLDSTDATNAGSADGAISGVSSTMEYSADGTSWRDVTGGTIEGLTPGTYSVRVKATGLAPHGVPATVTVATAELALIGDTTYTTLAAAIEAAQSGDTIKLLKDVTISNTITLKPGITIDGNGKSITHTGGQVFESQTGAPVTIKKLTIQNSGQALEVPSGSTVILDECTITNCSNGLYAAINMSGTVVLYKTTISGNSSTASNAGGVIELGYGAKLFGIDSTISNNTAGGHTGGINNGSGSVYLMKCKVTGNRSTGGSYASSLGGGVRNGANFYAANCVIAGNYSGPNTSDTLDIGGSPTLRNCIYGNVSTVDDTKVTGSTGGGSGSAPIPDGKRTDCSYTVSDGQLNITMRYQDGDGNMQDLWARPASSVTTEPSLVSGLTYTGSAQALVNGGTANGGTLVYAVGTNATTAPTEGWGSDIPKRTAAGTYYVWYKVRGDIDHSDSTAKCITVTIKSQGGGGGSTSGGGSTGGGNGGSSGGTESYTIPVINENTVNVKTEITDRTAVVGEITQKDIDKIVDTGSSSGSGSENTSITIDISQAKSEVTSVELSKTTVEKIAETTQADNNVESVEIKMSNATVELDGAALTAISEQAEGNSIKLVVEGTNTSKLNESQQESLKQFASASPFEAYFESDGKRIHDFKGGTARVSLKFTPKAGRSLKHYHVYYLSLAGAIERFVTYYANGLLSFVTSHFSDYAIVYDEEMENGGEFNPEDPVDPVDPEDPEDPVKIMEMHRLYNPNSGEHFYTADVEERDYLVDVGWNYEGVAWYAPEESEIPVYRLYNSNAGDHHYTMDIEERDDLIAEGWNDEGIGWYSVESEDVALYRVYNPNALEAGAHHYTADVDERDYLVVVGWSAEGIGWYGMNEEAKELMK